MDHPQYPDFYEFGFRENENDRAIDFFSSYVIPVDSPVDLSSSSSSSSSSSEDIADQYHLLKHATQEVIDVCFMF